MMSGLYSVSIRMVCCDQCCARHAHGIAAQHNIPEHMSLRRFCTRLVDSDFGEDPKQEDERHHPTHDVHDQMRFVPSWIVRIRGFGTMCGRTLLVCMKCTAPVPACTLVEAHEPFKAAVAESASSTAEEVRWVFAQEWLVPLAHDIKVSFAQPGQRDVFGIIQVCITCQELKGAQVVMQGDTEHTQATGMHQKHRLQ